jgi:hypothetical protein
MRCGYLFLFPQRHSRGALDILTVRDWNLGRETERQRDREFGGEFSLLGNSTSLVESLESLESL